MRRLFRFPSILLTGSIATAILSFGVIEAAPAQQPDQQQQDQGQQPQDQQQQDLMQQQDQMQPEQGQQQDQQSTTLFRQENTPFRLAFVAPGTDWPKYRTIQLRALEIPPDAREGGSGRRTRFGESYILGDREVAALQQAYNTAMRNVLGNAGYTFVDTPQADTLIVAPQVLRIRLNAPVASTRYSGRQRIYSRGAGSITIAAVLADGQSGEVLAQVVDHSYPSNMWRINNRVTNLADARTAFGQWARALRDTLKGS